MHRICGKCDGYMDERMVHDCIRGITDNINRLHSNLNLLLKTKDEKFWEGFDACWEMVINSLDSQDSNEIAKFSVFQFIEDFKEHLVEEAELYKKDA